MWTYPSPGDGYGHSSRPFSSLLSPILFYFKLCTLINARFSRISLKGMIHYFLSRKSYKLRITTPSMLQPSHFIYTKFTRSRFEMKSFNLYEIFQFFCNLLIYTKSFNLYDIFYFRKILQFIRNLSIFMKSFNLYDIFYFCKILQFIRNLSIFMKSFNLYEIFQFLYKPHYLAND